MVYGEPRRQAVISCKVSSPDSPVLAAALWPLTSPEAGTTLSTPRGMKGWIGLWREETGVKPSTCRARLLPLASNKIRLASWLQLAPVCPASVCSRPLEVGYVGLTCQITFCEECVYLRAHHSDHMQSGFRSLLVIGWLLFVPRDLNIRVF